MKLSRKWLNEFVNIDVNDKEFAEAMTLSGSKVETTEDLGAEIKNVVVGRIRKMERHPDSDHMWVCRVDAGQNEPVQIVTGAWNIHEGDLVPVALHKATLPGGKKIERGKLRGVLSDGMLCSLSELGLDERDFPYAAIEAAALLNDYHPIDPEKPSIPADIKPGDKVFGPVICAGVANVSSAGDGKWECTLIRTEDDSPCATTLVTDCQNLHQFDLVAYNTKTNAICTLSDLHAEQREFPHCINDGIFVLHEDCQPGDDIKPVINADDHVVEFEITPNRPDCLSVIGLAREVSATFDTPLTLHEPVVKGGGTGDLTELLDVETPDPELCPRYTARMVRNVKIGPSPKWMRERLRSMGVRPINNIVDITNYVMLEYGQPMHAFDYRYVKGGKIIVRRAQEGEELTTLDGNVRKLTANMLVIADETRAVGLAGIMGGENSEIVDDTVDVVFESANFDGTCIRKAALALGMRTEASAKFEKGLDPLNTLPAVDRACELVELLGAGEVIDGVIDVLNHVPQPRTITMDPARVNALLGTDIAGVDMYRYLERVDIHTENHDFPDGPAQVSIPSWRGDVEGIADLAEEVARFHGYNNIPVTLQRGETTQGGYSPVQQAERRLGSLCRSCGYSEIITYSFISPACYDKIGWAPDEPLRDSLKILNPLGEDTSIMRTTTLPSMLDILARNYSYRSKDVRLYEIGRVYLPGGPDGLANEPRMLTLGAYGEGYDFFTMKGAVESILRDLRVADAGFRACQDDPSYHPGRCAGVYAGEKLLGVVGQIHPAVAANYDVDCELYCAELSFEALLEAQGPGAEYHPLPRFPAVSRDIAVVCGEEVTVGALEACIRKAGGRLLRDVALFDIYRGQGVAGGSKSVAFSMTLRADDRSITASEADGEVKDILTALEQELGATLR
ncbi:MAG: phenylalanine--tRNA ligase subunit beta [Oscillospiraceae bacterium]|nr:phenylalanine--tRNA ligase subunit beta [Oscillospiraceae bacterium]